MSPAPAGSSDHEAPRNTPNGVPDSDPAEESSMVDRQSGGQHRSSPPVDTVGSGRPCSVQLRTPAGQVPHVPAGEDEHSFILDLLDRIAEELNGTRAPYAGARASGGAGNARPVHRTARPSPPPDAAETPRPVPVPRVDELARPPARRGVASDSTPLPPYLEERLAIASGSIQSLGAELEGMGARWQRLEAAAGVLEREIGNATRELSFIRGIEDAPAGATVPGSSPTPRTRPPADRSAIAPAPGTPAPYGRFTVARYNSTVASLKGRRQWLQWGTLGIGAALSAALVALAVLAREPMPATWLAILPAIWMIPVPFFVLSFLGTHRVLRRNHLELSGGA